MTMDVSQRKASELKSADDQTAIQPIKVVKRPFDVAFLMLPDDKLKQKQKLAKSAELINYVHHQADDDSEDEEIEVGNNQDFLHHHRASSTKYFTQKQQIFDDPSLVVKPNETQKSAFTKVSLKEPPRLSPNLSMSPELAYQHSLSPSPPCITRAYPQGLLSPFKTHQMNAYPPGFVHEHFAHHNEAQPNEAQPRMRPMYRPEMAYGYQHQEALKMGQELRGPAAAILSSLLPPSLAALSLPAQNVCAKCNISFRMTSDLVYHMRSHHKNDSMDMYRRRREEKLKCPVCAESFRERHHLTRHMTAHQDKEADEGGSKKKPSLSTAK